MAGSELEVRPVIVFPALLRMRRPRPIDVLLACGDFGACGSRFRPRERSQ